jgi:hypothetical protein
VIKVGAPTEAEMKSKKEALDDAISATKAAIAEGIVPGGGLALLRCTSRRSRRRKEKSRRRRENRRPDSQACARSACPPDRENSAVDGGVVVARMLEGQGNYGFDAARQDLCRSCRSRHHRPGQGRPHCAGKRRVRGERIAAHRGHDDGDPRSQERAPAANGGRALSGPLPSARIAAGALAGPPAAQPFTQTMGRMRATRRARPARSDAITTAPMSL